MAQNSNPASRRYSPIRIALVVAIVAVITVLAVVASYRVPQTRQQANQNSSGSVAVAAAQPLPPEPVVIKNRIGTLKSRNGTTLIVSAQTIVGGKLELRDYTIRTGADTVIELVDLRQPLTTTATAKRTPTTLDAIPVGAQVNALASSNIVSQNEFAAIKIEYQLIK